MVAQSVRYGLLLLGIIPLIGCQQPGAVAEKPVMPAATKTRVLILCTGNSCRSQIAEALWRHEGGDRYEVVSAGTAPKGVHPLTGRVLEEIGVSIAGQRSKHISEFTGQQFELVVTVCDHARDTCPVFPAHARQEHWPFEDPAAARGSDEEVMAVFRRVRDQIGQRIHEHLRETGASKS